MKAFCRGRLTRVVPLNPEADTEEFDDQQYGRSLVEDESYQRGEHEEQMGIDQFEPPSDDDEIGEHQPFKGETHRDETSWLAPIFSFVLAGSDGPEWETFCSKFDFEKPESENVSFR